MKQKQRDIHFHLSLMFMLKIPGFFSSGVKIDFKNQKIYIFLLHEHIFKSKN